MSNNAEDGSVKNSKLRNFFLFVIAPAIITGLFSLSPVLYSQITSPKAELKYSKISGPNLIENGQSQQIISITIINSGKLPLTNIEAFLNVESGFIKSQEFQKNLLRAEFDGEGSASSILIPRMLPEESISVAFLVVSESEDSTLNVELRSSEALGYFDEISEESSSGIWMEYLSAGLAALSVVIMGPMIMAIRGGKISYGDKSDYISLTIGLSGVNRSNDILFSPNENVTYRRLADGLLCAGIRARDVEVTNGCVKGLKALLLIKGIADGSILAIRENLKEFGFEYTDEQFKEIREKALSTSDPKLHSKFIEMFH